MRHRLEPCRQMFQIIMFLCSLQQLFVSGIEGYQTASLLVDASPGLGRQIPDTLFGIFFEEISHAGAGGLWAELVNNRGFEAQYPNNPPTINPWSVIGDSFLISVSTDGTSCFSRNPTSLRMEVLCGGASTSSCPDGGVGIYNPGFWGMNIEQGKTYKLQFFVKSSGAVNLAVSLTSSDGSQELASSIFTADASGVLNWVKAELLLQSAGTNTNSRLQLTTSNSGAIWLDQVSLMPLDTYQGHGFRNDLFTMISNLKPQFLRVPGGCYVECGNYNNKVYHWKDTVGPWQERPGHFNNAWYYWSDDGLGYYEFLQLAEDLGAPPVWVVPSAYDGSSSISSLIQDALDSIEFARGGSNSAWGSVRAAMGHPAPFQLSYVAIGNEACGNPSYKSNYLQIYSAIKSSYPDIKIISNCDGSTTPLDQPADLYDYHIYAPPQYIFSGAHHFDKAPRGGAKAFVSEYASKGPGAGAGNLLGALAEAAFLIGLEINSDVVEMASYAPLFANVNDAAWTPDAIYFDSWHLYGTPSYWMQHFFKESNGATLHSSDITNTSSSSLMASALTLPSTKTGNYHRIKIVNFGNDQVNLHISIASLQANINSLGSSKTVLTSSGPMDENSLQEPTKVVPVQTTLPNAGTEMDVALPPYSLTSIDLLLGA